MIYVGTRRGFTLVEVLLALAVVAMIAALVVPNFVGRGSRYEREQFVARLNALVQAARQHSIMRNAMHKVVFDLGARKAWVAIATGKKDAQGQQEFKPLHEMFTPVSYQWDARFAIKQFIIEGFDEMKRSADRTTVEVHFFVVPEGLTQEVTINFIDTADPIGRKPRQIGLVLNPFTAWFEAQDGFAK